MLTPKKPEDGAYTTMPTVRGSFRRFGHLEPNDLEFANNTIKDLLNIRVNFGRSFSKIAVELRRGIYTLCYCYFPFCYSVTLVANKAYGDLPGSLLVFDIAHLTMEQWHSTERLA